MTESNQTGRSAEVQLRGATTVSYAILYFAQRHCITEEQARSILTRVEFDPDKADALAQLIK